MKMTSMVIKEDIHWLRNQVKSENINIQGEGGREILKI